MTHAAASTVRRDGRDYAAFRLPDTDVPGADLLAPAAIGGRFEPIELFAVGVESVILRALDRGTGGLVLVKTLRPDVPAVSAEHLREELRRARHGLQTERRLIVRLRNAGAAAVPPPIAYVYDRNPSRLDAGLDVQMAELEPYFVMAQVQGATLEGLIAGTEGRGLPWREVLELIRPVVRVLAILHEPWRRPNGHIWSCVYQDLKPSNILIDPLRRPHLIDFGGCQVVVAGVPVLEGSRTIGYAAPECEGPPRVLLPCADVYTIGSTLHHALTGVDPRDRLAARRGAPGGHLRVEDLPAGLPRELRDLIGRCLAPRPSDRPADARAVGAVLDRIRADERGMPS